MEHKQGIFFSMSDEEYHSVPALSNSGIKWLLVSPTDFWARSWMNPGHVDEDTDAMIIGRAYHTRILEGKAKFDSLYAPALHKDDFPKALVTVDDIKNALKERKLTVSGNKPVLIERLLADSPDLEIWDHILAYHAREHEDRTLLSKTTFMELELAAAMIERHSVLSKCFTGGYPEVSIFWNDPVTNTPMKSRIDYLKAAATIDLKSFANMNAKPIDRAIIYDIASRKYYLQKAVYDEAVDHAKGFCRDGLIYGDIPPREWLNAFIGTNDRKFVFVFQQKGIAPVARAKVMPHLLVNDIAKIAMRTAIDLFCQCREKYGDDIWLDLEGLGELHDDDFPSYMTMDV